LSHRTTALGCLLALAACRGDATPPLYTAASEPPGAAAEAPAPAPPQEPQRSLWFATGPGRDAILARERQDHVAAVALLDQLLAAPDLSADDRGAAQWLRGLEDLRLGNFAGAAARFAEARSAPALALAADRLRLLEAQARLDAGDPTKALAAVGDLAERGEGAPVAAATIVTADAKARTGDATGAATLYARFLERFPESPRRHEVRAKWARLLVQSGEPEQLRRALELYGKLALDVPLSDYGEEATKAIPELEPRAGVPRSFAADRDAARKRALARMRDALARTRYSTVIHDADELLRAPALADADRCEAQFLKGSAIFKQHKRAKARPVFEAAAAACRKAGPAGQETLVKATYQAGRGRYAEDEFSSAAKQFEALAAEFGASSYADDALVLAGESWAEAGDRPRERLAYERVLKDVPAGDMAGEARRRLIVLAFTQDRVADALALADAGLAAAKLDLRERAKLHYFRGRALARQGHKDAAVAAYLDVLAAAPLSYASLQALSRLRDVGDEAFARGLAALEREQAGETPLELPASPPARRAQLLARLGLGQEAGEELGEAGVSGWPAVAVLAQAGLYAESQKLLGALGSGWRERPPVGQQKLLWSLAHPLAFEPIVRAGEATHQVPALLTFAIMQTESRFDPGVTSWAGARGLVQLMPGTAKDLARQAGLADFDADNLFQPALNLDLGTRYLGNLVRRFGGDEAAVPLAIPSYNAGAGAVERWLDRRRSWDYDLFIEAIPFDETRAYTQSVLERWLTYRWVHGSRDTTPEQRVPYIPLAIPGRTTGA
jgi:soluble lytic murein transglycosylase